VVRRKRPKATADEKPSAALTAFRAGDWKEARRLAKADLAAPDEATRASGRAVLARMSPDPVVIGLVVASLLLFVLVVTRAIGP